MDMDLTLRNCFICHSSRGVIMRSFENKKAIDIYDRLHDLKHEVPDSVMARYLSKYSDKDIWTISEFLEKKYKSK